MGGRATLAPITVAVVGDGLLFASSRFAGSESDPMDVPPWDTVVARYDRDKDGQLAVTEPPEADGIVLRREVSKETPGNFLPWRRALALSDADKSGIVLQGRVRGDAGVPPRERGQRDRNPRRRQGRQHRVARRVEGQPRYPRDAVAAALPRPAVFVRDGGMVTSYAADSGTVILDRQRLGALGQYPASPIAADGRIYASSEAGTIVVFRAADTLDVLARNDLGESITATPAIAADTLYVRTARQLWAFGS